MTSALSTVLGVLGVLFLMHICAIGMIKFFRRSLSLSEPSTSYLVLYGSQSGNAEILAKKMIDQLQQAKKTVVLHDVAAINLEILRKHSIVLWVVSTYGEGDAPDSAHQLQHLLDQPDLDLSDLSFAILALGDRRYQDFCRFGYVLEQKLCALNAQKLWPITTVDQLNLQQIQQWQNHLAQFLKTDMTMSSPSSAHDLKAFTLIQRDVINAGSLGAPIFKVQLRAVQGVEWRSGDIFELQCENTHAQIEHFLKQHQLDKTNLQPEQLRWVN
ncbi:MAG: flavodoxin domain-containing protein, partial [Acinetobacter sp.]